MKKIFSSQWSLSMYALLVLIGGAIGNLIVSPNSFFISGALSGSLLIVVINFVYVIYKKGKSKSSERG